VQQQARRSKYGDASFEGLRYKNEIAWLSWRAKASTAMASTPTQTRLGLSPDGKSVTRADDYTWATTPSSCGAWIADIASAGSDDIRPSCCAEARRRRAHH
jgi:hypothetical protein